MKQDQKPTMLLLSNLLLSLPPLPSPNNHLLPSPPKTLNPNINPINFPQLTIINNNNNNNKTQGPGAGPLTTCFPSLSWAHIYFARPGCFNFQLTPGEAEPEEALIRRFNRETRRAGIRYECRRRSFFESKQDKKKRKAREAGHRNRIRKMHFQHKGKWEKGEMKEGKKEKHDDDDDNDNWELPEGDIPDFGDC